MYINKKSLIISLSFSISIALFIGIFIIQRQPFIRHLANDMIHKMMLQAYNCHFDTNVESVNIFSCSIICRNVRVYPKQNNSKNEPEWTWQADRFVFHFSPLDFLFFGKLMISIHASNAQITSLINQKGIPFANHIQDLFFGAQFNIPLAIKLLKMQNVQLTLHNDEYQTVGTITWSGTSKKINQQLKSMLYLNNGSFTYQHKKYVDNISGTLYSKLARNGTNSILLDARATLPQHHNQACFIDGQLHEMRGNLYIRSQDKQFIIQNTLSNNILSLNGTINTNFLQPFISSGKAIFTDNLIINSQTSLATTSTDGTITSSRCPLSVKFHYNNDNTLNFIITNKQSINELVKTGWSIVQDTLKIKGSSNKNKTVLSLYIPLSHNQTTKKCLINGDVAIENNIIKSQGTIGRYHWNIQGTLKPILNILDCTISNGTILNEAILDGAILDGAILDGAIGTKSGTILGNLHCQHDKTFSFGCTLNYQELKTLLPESIRHQLDGNATIALDGTIDSKKIKIQFTLKDGIIIFGNIHNILTGLSGQIEIDYHKKQLNVYNLQCTFHQGRILCPQATIIFNQNWQLESLHIPCSFDQCLVGIEKNFSILSGNILFQYAHNKPSIHGTIIANRSFIHDFSFFARAAQTNRWLIIKPIELNLNVETREPTRIHTDQIQTHLHTQLEIKQHHMQPHINGVLRLQRGSIILPYSNLKIIHGALYFAADHNLDPLIELLAKTNMHPHIITLQVTGSLRQPMVRLSSVPALPEEKIAALLITGSPNVSLNMIAPALVIEYLKQQILEHRTLFEPQRKVQMLFRPLKHIKFMPTFADETVRTGLYGGIEIDLGKRLQAKVQKNLNLEEDTLFEINYRLSDEINLQAFKNDQGGIGGQVQMHLKW